MRKMPGFELIGNEEKQNILDLFDKGSDFERGPTVKEFQEKIASTVGVKYAQAVTSCTAALKVAVEALELDAELLVSEPVHAVVQQGDGLGPVELKGHAEPVRLYRLA